MDKPKPKVQWYLASIAVDCSADGAGYLMDPSHPRLGSRVASVSQSGVVRSVSSS